jgi:hypothetical protein
LGQAQERPGKAHSQGSKSLIDDKTLKKLKKALVFWLFSKISGKINREFVKGAYLVERFSDFWAH